MLIVFDKLEPFLDGLEDADKARIQGLIDITNERISGFRKKLLILKRNMTNEL